MCSELGIKRKGRRSSSLFRWALFLSPHEIQLAQRVM